ncbi:hypothetical protein C8Q69DRAFT_446279 [Paecilomyces variotii]|uniref:Uncharacterized protein n=1 Tax=Byssochlamys spectabilis TaxID=264951 RepID=A0A443HNU0_BYSSP|nr:hypothetical protein C8Q69DRAFT_446279 [Paecilomyces variotii]KAJ9352007.1 hypothetical protein DTO280E4_7951 [Paecilomyces variotii]RWQ93493.1 hypothetical protein C8Q69DRAFT_446279 [Paecilomyces variotii]
MNHQAYTGLQQPTPAPDNDVIMRPPSSTTLGPDARAEAHSSRQAVTTSDNHHAAGRHPALFQKTKIYQFGESSSLSATSTSPRLRRRASQGSLRSGPSAVSRFLAKGSLPLQLPPFDSLGITSRPSLRVNASAPLCASFHGSSSGHRPIASEDDYSSSLPLTPPADDDDNVGWNPRADIPMLDVHLNREPKPMAHMHDSRDRKSSSSSDGMDSSCGSSDRHSIGNPNEMNLSPTDDKMQDHENSDSWLQNGIDAAISSLPVSNILGEAVKIVSQTLPYPRAADKSVALPTRDSVFCSVVQAIQNRLRPGQSPYINITHAVPEQFSLSNLPSSPPSTPSMAFGGDDYFQSTVFSSATPVPAYHDFRGPLQSSRTSYPIVPPHSVHLAIVERYLPPSSIQEYKDFFCPDRPSVLVDRLKELSPCGGSLLLIYPTKKGAQSFKTQYLGPILDPLLRQMVVVNELSADVGRYLGKFGSPAQMDDFESMKSNINLLCQSISNPSSKYTLVDAERGTAHLDRNLWAEWYIQQERARMKEVLNIYWRNGQRLPVNKALSASNRTLADKEVTSAMLLGEIFDGIKRRPYGDGGPRDGVELGVFVIRRSR